MDHPPAALWRPSPNHGERRGGVAPDMVVIHYTAMASVGAASARLCDPAAAVSAHYLIARDGRLFALVAEERRAWHAGASFWAGERDVNSRSIGIELDHPGLDAEGAWLPYAEAQIAALERLLAEIRARWRIAPERVVGHACVAPARKRDPGPAFDWRRLAHGGLAVWLDPAPEVFAATGEGEAGAFRKAAARLGLDPGSGVDWDAVAEAAWAALAARFLPALVHKKRPSEAAIRHLDQLSRAFPGRSPDLSHFAPTPRP